MQTKFSNYISLVCLVQEEQCELFRLKEVWKQWHRQEDDGAWWVAVHASPHPHPLRILGCQDYEFFINCITTAKIYIYSNNLHKIG